MVVGAVVVKSRFGGDFLGRDVQAAFKYGIGAYH